MSRSRAAACPSRRPPGARALLLALPALLAAGAPGAGAKDFLPIPPSVIKEVETGKAASPTEQQALNKRIEALKAKALSDDPEQSLAALRELKGMAGPARPTLVSALRLVLTRDRDAVEAAVAGIGDSQAAVQYEAQIDALRKEARDNVPKLSKEKPETIKRAHELYDQLGPMTAKMNQAWSLRLAVIEGMGRRRDLIGMWREVAPSGDKEFSIEKETALRTKAVRAAGDILERTAGLTWGRPPSDESLKPLWFFGMCRKIERYNESLFDKLLDPEEVKNFRAVNTYREAIGLLPYELDPRLVQSARRHSKSMVEGSFFAHDSPLPGLKSPTDRAKAAGYPGGVGENIAYGGGLGGEGAFNMWFDSPGHHQNMAGGYQAMGIGRWSHHFTQTFGGAARLMLVGDDERARAQVQGTVLAPDTGRREAENPRPGRRERPS